MVMSAKQLKYGVVFFTLFAFGIGVAALIHHHKTQANHKHQLRTLASVKDFSTIKMEKHLMPVAVQIDPPAEFPEGPGELVTVKGKIRTNFENFGSISYEWVLPEGVQLIKGHATGDIVKPMAGQDYEVELTLQDFDRQYRKELILKAKILDPNDKPLHNSAVITSRPEDSMEHLAPVMMVQAREFSEKNRRPASVEEKQ